MSIIIEELTHEERVNKLSFFNTGGKKIQNKNKPQMGLLYICVKK